MALDCINCLKLLKLEKLTTASSNEWSALCPNKLLDYKNFSAVSLFNAYTENANSFLKTGVK